MIFSTIGIEKAASMFKSQRDFAKNIGVSTAAINKWLSGDVIPKAERAMQIEKATNGAVTRAEIRPDIFGSV